MAHRAGFVAAPTSRPMGSGLEVTAVRRDGTEFFADVQLSPFATRDGQYTFAVIRDITARQEEARYLRDLASELEAANESLRSQTATLTKLDAEKNALLGMAAHDLRTPLSVVLGYAELLTTVSADDPMHQHRDIVDVIHRTAKLMQHILDDLLDWSAIESGTLRLARHPVDPINVAADAVALAGLTAARRGIAISLEAEPDLPSVDLDTGRIGQVLGNLLGNALKYSAAGAPVRLQVARSGRDSVEFAVVDRGQGIEPQFVSRMFKPFETGGNTPTDGERSTGLGLAIVKRIVDAHGGTISVESEPGVGSTFRVRLPIQSQLMNRSTSTKTKNATET